MDNQQQNGTLIGGGNEGSEDNSQLTKMTNGSHQVSFKTSIREQAVTEQRPPYIPKKGDRLTEPGTARATIAPSKESPNGTTEDDYARRHQDQTIVMQHVDYWDRDHDGIIWPQDTYIGCREYGWGFLLSTIATYLIHVGLSYPTCPTILPDPFFRIYMARLYKDKHGSDTMTYDNEGRYRPQNFEEIFTKYDRGGKGGLSWGDLMDLWKGQRMVFDFFGWTASFLEWTATYLLLWPEDGVMRKEDIRAVYDGSIFYKKAQEHAERQNAKSRSKHQSTALRRGNLAKIS